MDGDKTCSMVDGNGIYHHLTPSSFEEIAQMVHADVKNIAGDDHATITVAQNYAYITQSFEIYIYEITTDASWLVAVMTR